MALAYPPLNLAGRAETLAHVEDAARHRLYPSLTNPNWLVLRSRRKIFERWCGQLPGNLTVLDVGGRIQPYRLLLANRVARYIAIDLHPTPVVDVGADAEQLPFGDSQFSMVVCTQTLEYARDPGQVIGEIMRVLQPGGFLFLSVPSLWMRDSEQDRWRFWPAALRDLLRPFAKVEIAPEGGSIAGFFRTVNAGIYSLAPHAVLRALLSYTIIPALNLMGLFLEKLVHSRNETFVVNYSVLAQK